MSLGVILLIVLIVILLGGVGGPYVGAPWPAHYGVGWGGTGIVGVILVVILILLLLGRI